MNNLVGKQFRQWLRYFLAAKQIQACFRNWKSTRHWRVYRHAILNHRRLQKNRAISNSKATVVCSSHEGFQVFHPSNYASSSVHKTDLITSFQKILEERGSFEDRMGLWRAIIDLRRAYFAGKKTDLILRALMEAKGDYQRAYTLLGMQEFYESHGSPLPIKLRNLFLPSFDKTPASEVLRLLVNSDDCRESTVTSTSTSGHGLDLIRALRDRARVLKRLELLEIFNEAVSSSYFSGNFSNKNRERIRKGSSSRYGHKKEKGKGKIPNKKTVKEKYEKLQHTMGI
jgi:hypothetical protein